MLPPIMGLFGKGYIAGALILGAVFLAMAVRLAMTKTNTAARYLLLTSVLYLPLLLTLMVADKF
jgi:heme O synthase-like polyprenyltransferase